MLLCYFVAFNKMRDVNPWSRDIAVLLQGDFNYGLVKSVYMSIKSKTIILREQWEHDVVDHKVEFDFCCIFFPYFASFGVGGCLLEL